MERYKPRYGNSWVNTAAPLDRLGGILWGYQVVGRFQSEEEIRNYPINNDGQNNRTQLPGDLIYKDVNGDGTIDYLDERTYRISRQLVSYAFFRRQYRFAMEEF